jgi:hypothetical protein
MRSSARGPQQAMSALPNPGPLSASGACPTGHRRRGAGRPREPSAKERPGPDLRSGRALLWGDGIEQGGPRMMHIDLYEDQGDGGAPI